MNTTKHRGRVQDLREEEIAPGVSLELVERHWCPGCSHWIITRDCLVCHVRQQVERGKLLQNAS